MRGTPSTWLSASLTGTVPAWHHKISNKENGEQKKNVVIPGLSVFPSVFKTKHLKDWW
jgi:hypothetical protein